MFRNCADKKKGGNIALAPRNKITESIEQQFQSDFFYLNYFSLFSLYL